MLKPLQETQTPDAAPDKIPQHVAVIMDGNGRWAKQRSLPRVAGHRKGAETLREMLEGCRQLGIRYLTIYAFSAENWERPSEEVSDLMGLLRHYLNQELPRLVKNGIRLRIIGDRARLEKDILRDIEVAEKQTAGFDSFYLTVALSYGSRQEILRAVESLARDMASGKINGEALNEEILGARLDTCALPDPDLLIRTGGEQRLSNFLLWQSAYTELFFSPVMWPDFTVDHLREALQEYARRERRFGRRHHAN